MISDEEKAAKAIYEAVYQHRDAPCTGATWEVLPEAAKADYRAAARRALSPGAADAPVRRFPIMGGPSIPWWVIAPHEAQAQKNHSQTLVHLAQRGGLSPTEALAVLEDRAWHHFADAKADHARFSAMVMELDRPKAETSYRLADLMDRVSQYRDCLAGAFVPATAALRRNAMFAALDALKGDKDA